ncbi:MAG: DinB family protein [Bacteroidota bacterium]
MEIQFTIHRREEILAGLANAFREVNDFSAQLTQEQFVWKPGPKWSIAEHLDHLIRSTKGLASALKMPKIAIRAFGIPNRPSREFKGLVDRYHSMLRGGLVASGPYVPEKDAQFAQDKMLANWTMIGHKFDERLKNWSEKNLDHYLLPHPALGKLTIREMMFFTIYHNYHHLRAMKELWSAY